MRTEREIKLAIPMQGAIEELQRLIKKTYPEATFSMERSAKNPRIIHLLPLVDVDDQDEVLDIVIDGLGELQTEEHLPIFVVPVRPEARNEAIRAALKQRSWQRLA